MMDFQKGSVPVVVTLELHRHGATNFETFSNGSVLENEQTLGGNRELTHCVFESVNWTHSTSAPFETLNLTMRFTGRQGDPYFEQEMPGPGNSSIGFPIPQVNDWVVLKTFSRDTSDGNLSMDTVFLARVHKARGDHRVEQQSGIVDKSSVTLSCEGFFDFLGKNNVCVGLMPTQGTLYNTKDWTLIKAEILQDMLGKSVDIVGTRFERLFKALAQVRLPSSLAGRASLSNAVRVVYNQSKSNAVASGKFRRNVEAVPGYRVQGITNLDPSSGSSLDLLMGSFMADPSMMEIFPSIEMGAKSSSNSTLDTSLSDSGGRKSLHPKLCLIIRMKPWRAEGIRNYARRSASLVTSIAAINQTTNDLFDEKLVELVGGGKVTDENVALAKKIVREEFENSIGKNLPAGLFDKATWPESKNAIGSEKMFFLEPSEVFSLSYELNDANHVNTVTARGYRQAASQLDFATAFMGLPYTNATDIQEFGVRFYRPEWPFFHIQIGEDRTEDEQIKERDFIRAVAAAALQIHGGASRFYSGEITLSYRPDLRTGMCFRAGHPLSANQSDPNKESLPPGGMTGGGQLVGYMESVNHKITAVGDGGIRAETVVRYVRGLFNEDLPPAGLSETQKRMPGNDIKNGWHQRFTGFTHLRRYSGSGGD